MARSILANRFDQQPTAALPIPFEDAIARLRETFVTELTQVTGLTPRSGDWEGDELAEARDLVPKYAGPEWTRRI